MDTPDTATLTTQLAQATQALADALHNLDAQVASMQAKLDRIVAAVDDGDGGLQATAHGDRALQSKLAELEKSNRDLKAQSAAARRKTLSPLVTALLAKEGVEGDALIEAPVLEKALAGLAIEQRIAVKAELARAGILT
jgi:septal ring factor EnvC (AmiA/AmiB activator)